LEKIIEFGFLDGPADPGMVYRHLRKLEEEDFVASTWDTTGTGPARRYYKLTSEGEELLRDWIPFMEKNLRSLEKFLQIFRQTAAGKGRKK
jgi:DNA-binding PadR family transcriptional regulator